MVMAETMRSHQTTSDVMEKYFCCTKVKGVKRSTFEVRYPISMMTEKASDGTFEGNGTKRFVLPAASTPISLPFPSRYHPLPLWSSPVRAIRRSAIARE